MKGLGLCLVVQLGMAFGMGGLLWPDKFLPVFDVLMFPWVASYRVIRANSIGAVLFSLLLLIALLVGAH